MKNLSEKIQDALKMLIVVTSQLQYGYSSSSKDLDEKLKKAGIIPPVKLYYDYKLPNNMSPEDYEAEVDELVFYYVFDENSDAEMFEKYTEALNGDEKAELLSFIKKRQENNDNLIVLEAAKVKALNPELRKIVTTVKRGDKVLEIWPKLSLLSGAAYGFAPEDIKYFINRPYPTPEQVKIENAEYDEFEKLTGIRPTYVLSPEHYNAIMAAGRIFEKRKNNTRS